MIRFDLVHGTMSAEGLPSSIVAQDFFVAGPPCQPFSILNSKRREKGYSPFSTDPLARPILECCRHVRDRKPKTFVIEEARRSVHHSLLVSRLSTVEVAVEVDQGSRQSRSQVLLQYYDTKWYDNMNQVKLCNCMIWYDNDMWHVSFFEDLRFDILNHDLLCDMWSILHAV